MNEKLTPEHAVRLLRAKAGELEAFVLRGGLTGAGDPLDDVSVLAADIALVASLLADHMDDCYLRELDTDEERIYAAGESNLQADWESALSEVLPEGVEPVPSQVAQYISDLKSRQFRRLDSDEIQDWGPDHPDYDEMGQ